MKKETLKNVGILVIVFLVLIGFFFGFVLIEDMINNNLGMKALIACCIVIGIFFLILEIFILKKTSGFDIISFADFLEANAKNLCLSIAGGGFVFFVVLGWYYIIKNFKFIRFIESFFPSCVCVIETLWYIITNKYTWITILIIFGIVGIKYLLYRGFIKK